MQSQRTRRSRGLRRDSTEAEKRLRSVLRRKRCAGCKFRRQHPIGKSIADFACPEARLAIELDGGQHSEQIAYDAARTAAIETAGYRVLRFWYNDVLASFDRALEEIPRMLEERR